MVLVTGRLAAERVKRVAEELVRRGVEAVVEVLPVDVALLAEPRLVEGVAARHRGSILVLPAGLRVDHDVLRERYGVVVVYGVEPEDALLLAEREPRHGELLGRGRVARCEAEPLGPVLRCGLVVPRRPPPLLILYEWFAARGPYRGGYEPVVLGFPRGASTREALGVLGESRLPGCWGVDSDNDRVILEAVERGASLVLSVDPGRRGILHSLPRGTGVVLIPSGLGEPVPPPRVRVERLGRLAEEAVDAGLVPILDPLLSPPCLGLLDSLLAYREASSLLPHPLLAGAGNVYELIDADSTGVQALLATLLYEAGVSVLLVTSESWKARHALGEALVAAEMVCASCPRRAPPKDLGYSLLCAREKRPAPAPEAPRPLDAHSLERVEFNPDPAGDNIVHTDGERLLVLHRWRDGRVEALEARDPETLYRAAIARGYVTRLDHAAWLGMELGRADYARRLGRTYSSLGGLPECRFEGPAGFSTSRRS